LDRQLSLPHVAVVSISTTLPQVFIFFDSSCSPSRSVHLQHANDGFPKQVGIVSATLRYQCHQRPSERALTARRLTHPPSATRPSIAHPVFRTKCVVEISLPSGCRDSTRNGCHTAADASIIEPTTRGCSFRGVSRMRIASQQAPSALGLDSSSERRDGIGFAHDFGRTVVTLGRKGTSRARQAPGRR
jgi:hypothetical protein